MGWRTAATIVALVAATGCGNDSGRAASGETARGATLAPVEPADEEGAAAADDTDLEGAAAADDTDDRAERAEEDPIADEGGDTETPPRTPAPEPFEPAACELDEPAGVGTSDARRASIAVAYGPDGGLVAWARDADRIATRRLDGRAAPTGAEATLEMPGAMDIRGLHRVGDRYVLVTHPLCPDSRRRRAIKCLFLRTLGPDGAPAADVLEQETGEWASGPTAVSGDALVMLRSHTYLAPVLERYRVADDGTITREQLGDLSHDVARGESEPPAGLALAVDGDRIAAWVRLYDEGAQAIRHHLHFGDGSSVRVRGRLPEGTAVEHLAFAGDDALFAVLSRGNALYTATIGVDGAMREGPTRLGRDAEPVGPRIHTERPRTSFGLARPGGRWTDPPVPLGTPRAAAADGVGGRYAVATVAPGRTPRGVEVRMARCGD